MRALVLEVFAGTQEIEQLTHQIHTTQQSCKQLFNAIPSHALVLDRHHYVTAANRNVVQVFGAWVFPMLPPIDPLVSWLAYSHAVD